MYQFRGCNVTREQFLRLYRTFYDDFDSMARQNEYLLKADPELVEDLRTGWDTIQPVTPEEAGKLDDHMARIAYFQAIRPERLFPSLVTPANKIHEAIQTVTRAEFDADGNEVLVQREQRYVLWVVPATLLGIDEENHYVHVLQCWCPTSKREHWIMVGRGYTAADPNKDDHLSILHSAIQRLYPGRVSGKIYRQGDIVFGTSHTHRNYQQVPHVVAET